MRARLALAVLVVLSVTGVGRAADRHWETGRWASVDVERRMFDFGPGASGFGGPRSAAPSMRAMADVRRYTLETDTLTIEFRDVVAIGHRSVDAVVGESVTFALDKKTIYVKDADGAEHKFSVSKKTVRPKSAA